MTTTPTLTTTTPPATLTSFAATSTEQWGSPSSNPPPVVITIPYTMAAIAVLFVIASLFVGIRLLVEIRSGTLSGGRCRKISFWAVILAYCLYIATFGMTVFAQNQTMCMRERGKKPTKDSFKLWQQINIARVVLGYTSSWLVKASFIATYFGISPHMPFRIRIALYISSIYVFLAYLITILVALCWCGDLHEHWFFSADYMKTHGRAQRCNSLDHLNFPIPLYIFSVMAVTSDVVVLIVPFLILYPVATKRRERIALVFLVSLGGISSMATIAKASWLAGRKEELRSLTSYYFGVSSTLTMTEVTSALIAVSLPSVRAVIARKWQARKQSKSQSDIQESGKAVSDFEWWERAERCPGGDTIMEIDSVILGRVSEEALHRNSGVERYTMSTMSTVRDSGQLRIPELQIQEQDIHMTR